MLQPRRGTRTRARRGVALMHHTATGAHPLQHQGFQASSSFGKREAMTELVTSHGLTLTPTSIPPTTPLPPVPTVDTAAIQGQQTTRPPSTQLEPSDSADTVMVTPLSPVATDPVVLTSVSPRATDPTSSKHRPPSSTLKQVALATLCLIELWSGVASLSSSLCPLGASLQAYCESNPP